MWSSLEELRYIVNDFYDYIEVANLYYIASYSINCNSEIPGFVLNVGDPEELKKKSLALQEGCQYRVKIYFYVQREIVQGLKYVQQSYRAGVKGKCLFFSFPVVWSTISIQNIYACLLSDRWTIESERCVFSG